MSTISNVHLNEFGNPLSNQKKDLIDVTCGLVGEKHNTFLKVCYALPKLLIEMDYLPSDHRGLNQTIHGANLTKLARAPFEFTKYLCTTSEKLSDWLSGEGKEEVRARDVAREANNLVNPVNEFFQFLSKTIVVIPSKTLSTIRGVTGASLTIAMGWNLIDTLTDMQSFKYSELKGTARVQKFNKMTHLVLKMANEVSFVALGILLFLTAFTQVTTTSLTMAALSASTVVFTILDYYYENLGTDKKNN